VKSIQIFNPRIVSQFILTNESLLKRKFPDPKPRKSCTIGRPRIAPLWIIMALAVMGRYQSIPWRKLPLYLQSCTFLVDDGYMSKIPSFHVFHQAWSTCRIQSLESWIRMLGMNGARGDTSVAIDSSGFETRAGSMWRFFKWNRKKLSRTSLIFKKVHIAISLPSRSIISITTSKSKDHDSKVFGKIWKNMYRRIVKQLKIVHLDKGYWSENIIGLLVQVGITPVIPCKKNSIDHGVASPMDQLVRLQKRHQLD